MKQCKECIFFDELNVIDIEPEDGSKTTHRCYEWDSGIIPDDVWFDDKDCPYSVSAKVD